MRRGSVADGTTPGDVELAPRQCVIRRTAARKVRIEQARVRIGRREPQALPYIGHRHQSADGSAMSRSTLARSYDDGRRTALPAGARLDRPAGASSAAPSRRRPPTDILTRAVPRRSEETLPAIGLGTFLTFDTIPRPDSATICARSWRRYWAGGARVVDTSPLYGTAEITRRRLRHRARHLRPPLHRQQDLGDRRLPRRREPGPAAACDQSERAPVARAHRPDAGPQPGQCRLHRSLPAGLEEGRAASATSA